jgi:cytochrome P450
MQQQNDLNQVPQPGTKSWFLDASPWYKAMRKSAPVFREPEEGTWHVFLYSDVERVLTQFGTFSSEFGYGRTAGRDGQVDPLDSSMIGSMIAKDPPFHTKLRNIVSRSFFPTSIALLEPRIREIASQLLIEASKDGKGMDFVGEFSDPFPVTVIAEMLGIPVHDRGKFKRWSDILIGSAGVSPVTQERSRKELAEYFAGIIGERKENPKEDLISSIVASEIDGQNLNLYETISFCMLLLIAGNETTTNLLGSAIRLFAKYDSLKQLHDNPSMVAGAIEEVLRFASPVRAMFRVSVKDSEISGHKIPSGQGLLAWIASANRDENKFVDADTFDIARKSNPHIAFGHGIHLCLGAPLARLESKVALQLIAEKYSKAKLRVAEEELSPVRNMVVGGVQHLPVTFS